MFEDRLTVWRERLTAPADNQHTIVAEDGGLIAGFACSFGADDARWGTLLDNIHVDPQLRRSGIGTTLICAAAAWAEAVYPDDGFYLWVLEANAPARHFYERFGARNAERAVYEAPGGGLVKSLRYVWEWPSHVKLAAS